MPRRLQAAVEERGENNGFLRRGEDLNSNSVASLWDLHGFSKIISMLPVSILILIIVVSGFLKNPSEIGQSYTAPQLKAGLQCSPGNSVAERL
jgi:hypothetical protein